jgi:pyridoxal phosphate enzyme (YggS family)
MRVREAIDAGASELGENYVQEARAKIGELASSVGNTLPHWHFIGHLQSNKAREAVRLFDLIQGVDSLRTAEEIGRQASKLGTTQPILLEVNLAPTIATRAGVVPERIGDVADRIATIAGVELQGLMTVAPPAVGGGEPVWMAFRRLREQFDALPATCRKTLSMGMSGDFEVAIEEGATMVRVGSAIFGPRR